MTPEERDRLVRVETTIGGFDDRLKSIESDLKKLVAAANMANGAWGATLKIGGLIVLILGAVGFVWQQAQTFLGKH